MTRAGEFRHIISIQTRGVVADEFGGEKPAWTNFATNVRAKKRDLSGRELVSAQAAQSEITTEFTIHYLAGLNTDMQIVEDSVAYDIDSIIDVGARGRELVIMAKSGRG